MPEHDGTWSDTGAAHDSQADVPKHGALGHLSADEELQQAVCSALIENTELDSSNVGVRVANENVTLSGRVKSSEDWRLALKIASEQRGVTSVQADELHIDNR